MYQSKGEALLSKIDVLESTVTDLCFEVKSLKHLINNLSDQLSKLIVQEKKTQKVKMVEQDGHSFLRKHSRKNGTEQVCQCGHYLPRNKDSCQVWLILNQSNEVLYFEHASNKEQDNRGPDEGTACRVHGKIPVLKGDGDKLVITSANTLNLPGLFGAIEMGGQGSQNFSHRIERFHFGDHVWGLVTPLSGTEKLSAKGETMYKYFIKVVPTVIHHTLGKTRTYQYSVTSMQREQSQSGHTISGITFSYEFVANVIEVYPNQISFIQLLLRLCAVVGGIFATSSVLHTIFATISSLIKPSIADRKI